jgi:hypothetical protein
MARAVGKPKTAIRSDGRRTGASGKAPPIVQIARRLGRMIPDEELQLIPKDLSDQIDHYLYGTPKR